jgi:hypothetical protein
MPRIDKSNLSETEKPYATVIQYQLGNLQLAVEAFEAALMLLKKSREPRQELRWEAIAGRDGSMTLWRFMTAGQAIKHSLDKAPALRASVKAGEINSALAQLRATFPRIKDVRDSVGHASELARSPDVWATNRTTAFEVEGVEWKGGGMWQENFSESTFFTTSFGGDAVSYELTDSSLKALLSITPRIYGAFP